MAGENTKRAMSCLLYSLLYVYPACPVEPDPFRVFNWGAMLLAFYCTGAFVFLFNWGALSITKLAFVVGQIPTKESEKILQKNQTNTDRFIFFTIVSTNRSSKIVIYFNRL